MTSYRRAFAEMAVVFGLQWGSEGKGQIVRKLTEEYLLRGYHVTAVRTGGVNAGHTAYIDGEKVVVCQLPLSLFVDPSVTGIIGAEGIISLDVLEQELKMLKKWYEKTGNYPNILIDRMASVIRPEHKEAEAKLVGAIGSTAKGVGAVTADKVWRNPETIVDAPYNQAALMEVAEKAGYPWITITDTILGLTQPDPEWEDHALILEGTQGSMLSLHTSGFYPYVTSRECTPMGIMAGAGVSPAIAEVVRVIAVARAFPIRVAGNSGFLPDELSWNEISELAGRKVEEKTTVTKKIRRVSRFDGKTAARALNLTRPTEIALTFCDYLDPEVYKKNPGQSKAVLGFMNQHFTNFGIPVTYLASGEGAVYVR